MNNLKKYILIGFISVVLSVAISVMLLAPKPKAVGTAVTAVPGVCNGTEPTTQLCNVNAYAQSVQGAFDVAGTSTLSGAVVLSGGVTLSGSGNTIANPIVSGGIDSISTTSATYTLTTTDLTNSLIAFTPLGAITTVTLPATSTMLALLATNGNKIVVDYKSIGTSTVLAAGAGGTLVKTSSTTIANGFSGNLTIIRDSATTYLAELINFPN